MKNIKLIIILSVLFLAFVFISYSSAIDGSVSNNNSSVYFTIEKGESVKQISKNLKKEGLIKNDFWFRVYVWKKGIQDRFLAGEHILNTNMNAKEVIDVLITGGSINNEKRITIIEGWRVDEIAQYLEEQGLFSVDDFYQAINNGNWWSEYDFLIDVPGKNLEGFLFPDTYRIFANATAEDIVRKMLNNFDQKLTEDMRNNIKNKGKNIFEVITMASIVEREAKTEEDMKLVADVFWKRIDTGMGLESDATVNYITGKSELRPTYSDLEVDSPYNTYKYRGLPPGPISNPGLTAILATIYPTSNNYFFFLMGTNGNTYYAETFDGHKANIVNYLD